MKASTGSSSCRAICAVMIVCLGPIAFGPTAALGQTLPSFEKAAEKAQAATVTVRIGSTEATNDVVSDDRDGTDDSVTSEQQPLPQITVFSGVSLGDGLLVTPLFAGKDARLRVTIAGGEQAKAKLLVLDQFCGLALLEMDRSDVPKIELAEELPRVGSWVISAAAWGVEKPIVSFGMVSGVERTLPAGNFPPVLQCNLTTVESSSGAGVVNQEGKLVGVIVAADPPSRQRGWAYAVPVKHVQRLIRAREGKLPNGRQPKPAGDRTENGSVIVLQSRRPHVGMVLDGNADEITVARVKKGGPAERAGIKTGDKIFAVDGIKIRSVYQATRPILTKQPGDQVRFLVQQENATRNIDVTLGGGVVVPGAQVGKLIEPKVVVESIADFKVPATLAPSSQTDSNVAVPLSKLPPGDLLKLAVDRYQTVIEVQQGQLRKQDRELYETIKRYKAAAEENRRLKSRIDSMQKSESR